MVEQIIYMDGLPVYLPIIINFVSIYLEWIKYITQPFGKELRGVH